MKIKINNKKANWVFLNGKEYKTNELIDLPFSDALRLSRIMSVDLGEEKGVYDPTLFKDQKKFAMVADVDSTSGWGNVGINLIQSMAPYYDISLIGKTMGVSNPWVIKSSKEEVDKNMAVVIHEQPKSEWEKLPFQKTIAVVPFETTQIPPSWIPRINKMSALFVPCKQNIEAFRDSGVVVPIELVHWGIDPTLFYPLERREGRPFTFGTMGSLSYRKGTDVLVKAFLRAFPTETDVKLICKTSSYGFMFATRDKRVQIDMTPVDHQELINNFFGKVDCFVFPTRGEGFGLTPLEAMATGIPAIVTNWSGPVEYMNEEVGWKLDYTIVSADDFTRTVYKEPCGNWAEPSMDQLIRLMRHAYEHRDEVKQKGINAAKYVLDNWTWDNKIKMFTDALEKHL